jgi:hypothetical protein
MIGITLSSEQIRSAPPEVRQWLEQQIAALLTPLPVATPHPGPQLVACSRQELRAVLEQIQTLLPVVGVFFELGREAASVPVQGMRALRLADILRHTRLQSTDQVVECLELITDALRRVRDEPAVMLCAVDREGNCYVAEKTAANILGLWHEIVGEQALQPPPAMPAQAADPPPAFRVAAAPDGASLATSPG